MTGTVPRLCIATFNTAPEYGGAERQYFLVADGMNRMKAGVARIVGAGRDGEAMRVDTGLTRVDRLRLRAWRWPFRRAIGIPAYVASLFLWLVRHRAEYDCVMVGAFDVSLVAVRFAARWTGRPFVIRYASLADETIVASTGVGRLAPAALRAAACVIVNSEVTRERLAVDTRISSAGLVRIDNGCAIAAVRPDREEARRRLGIDPASTVFINASSFHPGKGQDALIAAWPALRDGRSLLLFAGDGSMLAQCREAARAWEGEIRFLGRRGDLDAWLAASDVFVFPSRYPEGTPNALLEAMAMGLPCIVSESRQVREIAGGSDALILYDPDADDALANAVSRWRSLPDQGRSLGARAREVVVTRYRPEVSVERHVAVLLRACGLI